MKLYFEIDGLKGLISGYVESRYWYINKDYRQSDEYHGKDIYQKFEYLICKCFVPLNYYIFYN